MMRPAVLEISVLVIAGSLFVPLPLPLLRAEGRHVVEKDVSFVILG